MLTEFWKERRKMFQIDECIVYGMVGVCRVAEIGPMDMNGADDDREYYTLLPLYKKRSRVFTPVDNEKVIMRSVISKEEAYSLIGNMNELKLIEVSDDKHRELAYKESMKTCDCREYVRIINTVLKRKKERLEQGKKMSVCDEKYLKQAQESLYGELAISLEIEKDEVEEFILKHLEEKEMASAS